MAQNHPLYCKAQGGERVTEQAKERERGKIERELRAIAFANAADYLEVLDSSQEDRWVRMKPTAALRRGQRAALASVKEGKNGVELKLKDSLKALELLCKLYGLLPGDKKPPGQGSLQELLEGLRELEEPVPDEEECDEL